MNHSNVYNLRSRFWTLEKPTEGTITYLCGNGLNINKWVEAYDPSDQVPLKIPDEKDRNFEPALLQDVYKILDLKKTRIT